MKPHEEISNAVSLIHSHFSIAENELAFHEGNILEIEAELAKIITALLNQDMERLLHAFYRIDLDERMFKRIISEEPSDKIGLMLSKEVIKRELQKVKTREKYKGF